MMLRWNFLMSRKRKAGEAVTDPSFLPCFSQRSACHDAGDVEPESAPVVKSAKSPPRMIQQRSLATICSLMETALLSRNPDASFRYTEWKFASFAFRDLLKLVFSKAVFSSGDRCNIRLKCKYRTKFNQKPEKVEITISQKDYGTRNRPLSPLSKEDIG
jgi:hypothetical protein